MRSEYLLRDMAADAVGLLDALGIGSAHVVERYQYDLLGQDLSANTRALRVRALKRFCEHLVDTGVLFLDPTEGIAETPRGGRGVLPVIATAAEVAAVLERIDTSTPIGIRDRAMLETLYGTGIRAAELRGLDVRDLDLDAAELRVRIGKGARGRVVPVAGQARRWLRRYVREVRPRLTGSSRSDGPLFLTRAGRRLHRDTLIRVVKLAAERAGVPHLDRCHAFRHAFATHMLAAGADLVTVQRILGHASATTTQLYTRIAIVDLKEAHARTHPREREA